MYDCIFYYFFFCTGSQVIPNEDPLNENTTFLTLEIFSHLLHTGSDHTPPLGFSNEPEIRFNVDHTCQQLVLGDQPFICHLL